MKRAAILISIIILLAIFLIPEERFMAHAEENSEGTEQLYTTIEELLNSLDLNALEDYLQSINILQETSLKDRLISVISGDFSLDYSSLAQSLLSLFLGEVHKLFPAFAVILSISLLCCILNCVKCTTLNSSMSDIISLVGYLSIGCIVLTNLISVIECGFSVINSMKEQMDLIYPLLLTLMAGSGGVVSVAVYRPAVACMSGIVTQVFSSAVLPIAIMTIVLSFVGSLSSDIKCDKLSDLFKSINKWLIGLSVGLFGIFLTVQGLTSAQYDGISLQAAKYAISNSVPIVGGFLSGGVDLVLAGSALIKNAIGSFSIFLIFITALKPLIGMILLQLFLRLCAAANDSLGGNCGAFLSKIAADMGYFIAGLLCVAFLYFITLLLLICSSGIIVI